MPTIPERAAFERGVRPVLQIVLPDKAEAVPNLRADPELQTRIEELASNHGFARAELLLIEKLVKENCQTFIDAYIERHGN